MDNATRIEAACRRQHDQTGNVMPPTVCPYCMGCPLETLVVSITQPLSRPSGPEPIPAEHQTSINKWLTKLETEAR